MGSEYWSREELYELVWSKPFTDLAKEYAISDVGLRKACLKLEIPVPRAGYWAKIRSGQELPRPPLPVAKNGGQAYKPEKRNVVAKPMAAAASVEIAMLDEEKSEAYRAALAFEQDAAQAIIIRSGPPMTAIGQKTLQSIQKPTTSEKPVVQPPDGCLAVRVSPAAAERAISICEALLAAFERRGWAFTFTAKEALSKMKVTVFGFAIPFWIEEAIERHEHVLTQEEKKDKSKNPWRYSEKLYDYVPTGRLVLWMDQKPSYTRPSYRVRWADGKRMRIEAEIGDFCQELIHAAIIKRNKEIEYEIRRKEMALEEKRRRRAEFLKSLDERRIDNLKRMLARRDLMLQTLAIIDDVKERAAALSVAIEGDLADWIAWAEKFALRCDPLANGFPAYEVRNEWEKKCQADEEDAGHQD